MDSEASISYIPYGATNDPFTALKAEIEESHEALQKELLGQGKDAELQELKKYASAFMKALEAVSPPVVHPDEVSAQQASAKKDLGEEEESDDENEKEEWEVDSDDEKQQSDTAKPALVPQGAGLLELFSSKSSPTWRNWNKNQTTNAEVVKPKTLDALIDAVKNCDKDKKIRVSAYGHSWAPIVATQEDNNARLIVTRDNLTNILSTREDVIAKKNVTFESGVSVKKLQEWTEKNNVGFTVGANVVLQEVFMAAVATSLCHGAGYEWASVADMVSAISIIDADGVLHTYTAKDKELLSIPKPSKIWDAIEKVDETTMNHYRGHMGVLGVIYAITLDLVEDVTLEMTQQMVPVETFLDVTKFQEIVEKADGWIECFWVPLSDKVWVQTWARAPTKKAEKFNHKMWDFLSALGGRATYKARQLLQKAGLESDLCGKLFMKFVAIAMYASVKDTPSSNYYRWYDAIHYRDYIDDMRVEDTEFAIPIVEDGADSDYQKACEGFKRLHQVINDYAEKGEFPVDIVVEWRFSKGSDATLAHFPSSKANKFMHLEFLCYTVEGVPKLRNKWQDFIQDVANKWSDLDAAPHWAKGWQSIKGITETLRDSPNTQALAKFRQTVDPKGRFLNASLTPILQGPSV